MENGSRQTTSAKQARVEAGFMSWCFMTHIGPAQRTSTVPSSNACSANPAPGDRNSSTVSPLGGISADRVRGIERCVKHKAVILVEPKAHPSSPTKKEDPRPTGARVLLQRQVSDDTVAAQALDFASTDAEPTVQNFAAV